MFRAGRDNNDELNEIRRLLEEGVVKLENVPEEIRLKLEIKPYVAVKKHIISKPCHIRFYLKQQTDEELLFFFVEFPDELRQVARGGWRKPNGAIVFANENSPQISAPNGLYLPGRDRSKDFKHSSSYASVDDGKIFIDNVVSEFAELLSAVSGRTVEVPFCFNGFYTFEIGE